MTCSVAELLVSVQKSKRQKQWQSEVSPRFDKQDYNKQLVTNGAMKPLGAINIPHQALKCQDVSTQWSLRHLNSFAQELLNEFRYIFRKKKKLSRLKFLNSFLVTVSHFHAIFETTGCTHITSVPPQSFPESTSPSVTQMRMCKTNKKHTENMAKLEFETNYFIITTYWEYLLCRGNAIPGPNFYHRYPRRVLVLL